MRAVPWTLDVLLFCVAGLVLSMAISGGWQFTLLGRVASMRSLYTPMLVLTLLACMRVAWSYRANLAPFDMGVALRVTRLASAAAIVATAMLSPVLYAVGVRIAEGRWDTERIFWRSSPHGIDLVSFVLPNPNHILAPVAIREWLTGPSADALLRECRLPDMDRTGRCVYRVAERMAYSTLLGRTRTRVWRSRARPVRVRVRYEYPHSRSMGLPPIRPDRRPRPHARPVQHRSHAGGRDSVCRGALVACSAVA